MITRREDMGKASEKYFESAFVYNHSHFQRDPVKRPGRAIPIIIDYKTTYEACSLLNKNAGIFLPNRYHQIYLLDGANIEIIRDDSRTQFIGVTHETEVGVAYVVNKLQLPTEGLSWPNDLQEFNQKARQEHD